MAVVQDERLLTGHQARRLQRRNPIQTFLVDLDGETAGEQRRRLRQPCRIGVVQRADDREVAVEARMIESGLIQVLRGANEGARPSAHGVHQGPVVAARLRREEHHHLLRIGRHRHRQPIGAAFGCPGLAVVEPAFRRRIGGSAQERGHQKVMRGLRGGKVRRGSRSDRPRRDSAPRRRAAWCRRG